MGRKIFGFIVGIIFLLPAGAFASAPAPVPEPSTLILIGSAVAALAGFRRLMK
jgi:hypothetical protein